jgi:vacuolar protein sorting-associated protein 41
MPPEEEQEHGNSNGTEHPVHGGQRRNDTGQQSSEDGLDDNEEGEDDDEPTLNYERVGGDLAKVIKGDLVSAFCVGSKFIVRALRGTVWLKRVAGNRLS